MHYHPQTGPRTPEGKARSSQNARKYGLFSTAAIILPGEQTEYDEQKEALHRDLTPLGPMEELHFNQIVNANWRLRRCDLTESGLTEKLQADPAFDLMKATVSIDRARANASNLISRHTRELRKLQNERVLRETLGPLPGLASHLDIAKAQNADAARQLKIQKLQNEFQAPATLTPEDIEAELEQAESEAREALANRNHLFTPQELRDLAEAAQTLHHRRISS